MLTYLKTTLRERWILFLVVIIILSSIGLGYMGALSVTERMVIEAKDDLEKNWRYQYDILVLPHQSDDGIELEDGWVAPQASLATYGGISLEDLEKIRQISGVLVAAPLSHIGYVEMNPLSAYLVDDIEGEYSYVERLTTGFDGLSHVVIYDHKNIHEYNRIYGTNPLEWNPDDYSYLSNALAAENDGWKSFMPAGASLRQPNYLMLVAIDPIAENELFSFSESLILGNELQDAKIENMNGIRLIPIIALANNQTQMNETLKISRIQVPTSVDENDFKAGATNYLLQLPRTPLAELNLNTFSEEWKYKTAHIDLYTNKEYKISSYIASGSTDNSLYRFSPIQFENQGFTDQGFPLMMAKKIENINPYDGRKINLYRKEAEDYRTVNYGINIIDYYDSTKVSPKFKGSWVEGEPVDIYTPHHSMIIADGAGNPIDKTPLFPLPYKDTYYTGSPDGVTTIEVASKFYKSENFLSSIRVVVDGVEERNEASQRKVEEIAKEIMDLTGHHVEIMLGSTASKVHIDLDTNQEGAAGSVEEGWQQAGVSWSIQNQIEKSNIVLFFYLLLVGFVFCYTVITHSLLKRSTEFAMLRAIGWSRRKIIVSLLMEILMIIVISLVPLIITNAKLRIIEWHEIGFGLLIILPIIGIGYLSGSYKSLKLSPRAGLEGEGVQWKFMRFLSINGLFSYVLHQLLRRPLRFGLLSIVLSLTSFMVILFIATQKSLSNFLLLSFLGETIDLNIKGFQTAFLIVGIFLTISIVFLLLYLNITERKPEFFILRSIGWSLQRIQLYIGIEVLFIATVGSFIGGIGAYVLLTYFSSIWLPICLVIVIILTPPILMLLFSMFIIQSLQMKGVINNHFAI